MDADLGIERALDKALHEVGRLTIENLFLRDELERRPPGDAFERVQEILRSEVPDGHAAAIVADVEGPNT